MDRPSLVSNLHKDKLLFIPLMGIEQISRAFPYIRMQSLVKSIYVFDAWEPNFDRVEQLIVAYHINVAFFSAQQSAEHFARVLPEVASFWVPEGVRANEYSALPDSDRDIDVLQVGRKFDWYHDRIVEYCRKAGLRYLYEETKGSLVFPTRRDFLRGLSRARISVCVPSAITHPERSGNVSTMTIRYLQSMIAKCLVVGCIPEDMKELFDYSPVVEIDRNDPVGQLDALLKSYDNYRPLIERNYREVLEKHDWKHRMIEVDRVLSRWQERWITGQYYPQSSSSI